MKLENFNISILKNILTIENVPKIAILTYDNIYHINYALNKDVGDFDSLRKALNEKVVFICDRTRKYMPVYDDGFNYFNEQNFKKWSVSSFDDLSKLFPARYDSDKENIISPPMKRLRVEESVLTTQKSSRMTQ